MSGRDLVEDNPNRRISPQKAVNSLPVISGENYQHVGRYAGALVLATFERMGGVERMTEWADGNPTDFYTKLFPKVISRSQQVEHTGAITIDDAISKLEGATIDAEFEEVELEYDL